MEERTAITRLKRGDIGGLEVLVRRYQVQAARTAYLIVRGRALAEDIAQAAFVKSYEKIARFDSERPFGPWFMRIIVNDAVKAASRRERTVPLETGGPAWRIASGLFSFLATVSASNGWFFLSRELMRNPGEGVGIRHASRYPTHPPS